MLGNQTLRQKEKIKGRAKGSGSCSVWSPALAREKEGRKRYDFAHGGGRASPSPFAAEPVKKSTIGFRAREEEKGKKKAPASQAWCKKKENRAFWGAVGRL